MKAEQDWERLLGETLYDLPKERWAALEVDLMRRVREPVAVKVGWMERLGDWWHASFRPVAVGMAMATLLISVGWWMLRAPASAPAEQAGIQRLEHWGAGEVLHSDTLKTLAWGGARCTLSLQGDVRRLESSEGTRLRLEKGSVRFGVEPRRPGEVFSVEFGSCKATVVGTAFTLRVDSAGSWAGVEHGKVKVETAAGWSRFLVKGEEWSCREPAAVVSNSSDSSGRVVKEPMADVVRPASKARALSKDDPEWNALWEGCRIPSDRCLEGLADYLRLHPTGDKAAQAALLWADRSQQAGDLRDALYALDLAAHAQAGEASFGARLRIVSLKARELRQKDQAIKELDALIGSLSEGDRKSKAMRLRQELGGEKGAGPVRSDLP